MFNMDNEKNMFVDSKFVYIKLFNYLNNIYFQNKLDDLGCLLGDMRLLSDDISCDPAIYEDWKRITINEQININIVFEKCYDFLIDYSNRIHSKTLTELINNLNEEEFLYFIQKFQLTDLDYYHNPNYYQALDYFVNSNIPNYEFVRHLTNDRIEFYSSKSLWQGFAEVLVKRGLPKVKDVIKEMLMWYQDVNWPGFITIHDFIFEHKDELKDEILAAYQEAKSTNDYSWIEWLEEFFGVQLWT